MVSDSAQALLLSLITHQVTPWQSVCREPESGCGAQPVSTMLFSAVLQPMWWCCRSPGPVVPLQNNSLYWMAALARDPTPAAARLWLPAAKLRLQPDGSVLQRAEMDRFLLRCFRDFASADELYKKGG